jgi:hypothetical protein
VDALFPWLGQFTREAIAMRRELAELIREARRLAKMIG